MPTKPRTRLGGPRLGEPRLCIPCRGALAEAQVGVPAQAPLPLLIEPEDVFSGTPTEEPLVVTGHERMTVINYYALGGWANSVPDCWLRAGVHARLTKVCEALPPGFGLAVLDAWRPRQLQAELFAAAEHEGIPPGFIAPPTSHPLHPAPHETGGAVDVTLTVDGVPLALGTDFDEMVPGAVTAGLETLPGVERDCRRLLYWAMRSAGFVVYLDEWWHFEFGTRRWAAITGGTAIYAAATPL